MRTAEGKSSLAIALFADYQTEGDRHGSVMDPDATDCFDLKQSLN
jgi:hypothetical protein